MERALTKLGHAKLAGRCVPSVIFRNFLSLNYGFTILNLPSYSLVVK